MTVTAEEAKTEEFSEALEQDFCFTSRQIWHTNRHRGKEKQLPARTIYSEDGVLLTLAEDIVRQWNECVKDLVNPTDTLSHTLTHCSFRGHALLSQGAGEDSLSISSASDPGGAMRFTS